MRRNALALPAKYLMILTGTAVVAGADSMLFIVNEPSFIHECASLIKCQSRQSIIRVVAQFPRRNGAIFLPNAQSRDQDDRRG